MKNKNLKWKILKSIRKAIEVGSTLMLLMLLMMCVESGWGKESYAVILTGSTAHAIIILILFMFGAGLVIYKFIHLAVTNQKTLINRAKNYFIDDDDK